jgi:hypothetical protein
MAARGADTGAGTGCLIIEGRVTPYDDQRPVFRFLDAERAGHVRVGTTLDASRLVGHPQGMWVRRHMVAPEARLDYHAHLWVGYPLALPHVRLVVSVEPSGMTHSLACSMSSR